jgi:DNA gyrase subunit A
MVQIARELLHVNLEDEMRQSYLDYAMSVIVGRALPDVRDGLKPVHRRVLYAMHELGVEWNKPYKKSARVVGDVIGKYHPHGDTAVYDAMVRMAQPFSMRYMLVDGQGNFGSVDGDMPAAMRYTEVRMSKLAHALLADIEKETVDFVPNYDESESEPAVMPTRVPNLLVNGAAGIAVGMATNIPPHNLGEIVDACIAVIDNPDVTLAELMQIVPGPDFPTAGIINGAAEIVSAYKMGRGRIYVRARTHVEDLERSRQQIVVTELPYQVNKARLLERIADLVREKVIEGIAGDGLRDESDKDGLRVVIELKRGEVPDVVLNNLYKHTPLETVFGINMVGLVDGQPRLLGLKDLLDAFLRHRREVVTRRTVFDLKKARERGHVLEGQAVALANIDEVIAVIKASPSSAEARVALMSRTWLGGAVAEMLARAEDVRVRPDNLPLEYGLADGGSYRLSEVQAQAILDLRLHRLTGLERDKIVAEYAEILERIKDLSDILARPARLLEVIRSELLEIRAQFADPRRTEINIDHSDLTMEDLIEDQPVVVTLSRDGYAKSQPVTEYRRQNRGGRGRAATDMKQEDLIDRLFVANTHDTLLCFSNRGRVYWLKVYQLPLAGRGGRGKPIVNLLALEEGERINAMLPIREFPEDKFVFMATSQGTVKKTPLEAFSRPRTAGIIAVSLEEGDRLVGVDITDGSNEVMLATTAGKAIRFAEDDVRPMGREAAGVRGIAVSDGHEVNSLIVVREGPILTASENGYGKLTEVAEFPLHGRGGQGVIALQLSERNGRMVGAMQVQTSDDVLLISQGGTLVRTAVAQVSVLTRNTQGVRLMRLDDADLLVGMAAVEHLNGDGDDGGEDGGEGVDAVADADATAADAPAAPAAGAEPTDGEMPSDAL